MKQGMQLTQGLHQSLAPQLQQAIKLLQLSALELTQEIQRIMETNPLLEMDEKPLEIDADDASQSVTAVSQPPVRLAGQQTGSRSFSDDGLGLENSLADSQSLADYLTWQMNIADFDASDTMIATALIDAIDEDGYCREGLDYIVTALGKQGVDTTLDQVEAVLKRLQQFDPTGVGARDIQECLLLQLAIKDKRTPGYDCAKFLLTDYCHVLGHLNTVQLARKLKRPAIEIKQALQLIQSLNPRPGSIIGQPEVDYVIPDVVCERRYGYWTVHLNESISPAIHLNQQYVNLLRGSTSARDSQFMRENLREARWFLKSLETRNHTLLRVAQCIVERQQAFLEHGEEAMQPMILQDVASQLDIHESTVSRVTTHKYLYTPRGVYELKFFFSSHVKNNQGQHCSSTAIRALIKRYITAESADKPLSDSKIAELLAQEKQIKVARRTVTKYREAMNIASSNDRRLKLIKG